MRRILSIDGGGIKGTFPAAFLATIEDSIGGPIKDHFDLVVGTSTGGIIALALGLGMTASEILSFYKELGPQVFKGSSRWLRFKQLFHSKYSNIDLKNALESKFGKKRLGESTVRLVIPSMNLENGEVYIYKTAHHPKLERDYRERAVDVALATSAAPTFFPTHRSVAGIPLIDGGVWANNPVGLAAVEAIGLLQWPRDSVRVLSVGCTTEPLDVAARNTASAGIRHWGVKIIETFMAAQASASLGTAYTLLGHANVARVSPYVPVGRYGLDLVQGIGSLEALGTSEARKSLPMLREHFLQGPAEPFVPCHRLSSEAEPPA